MVLLIHDLLNYVYYVVQHNILDHMQYMLQNVVLLNYEVSEIKEKNVKINDKKQNVLCVCVCVLN